jgi:hypothetical protein
MQSQLLWDPYTSGPGARTDLPVLRRPGNGAIVCQLGRAAIRFNGRLNAKDLIQLDNREYAAKLARRRNDKAKAFAQPLVRSYERREAGGVEIVTGARVHDNLSSQRRLKKRLL